MKSHTISNSKDTTIKLTVCAVMVAMSTVLSFLKITELPMGGSVTVFSFIPVLFAGFAFSYKWGIASGLVYGVLQAIFGLSASVAGCGFKWWQVALCAMLDFFAAGAMLGTAGTFKRFIKSPQLAFAVGTVFACIMKFLCHFLSGYILFGSFAEWFFTEGAGKNYGAQILNTFSGNALAAIYSLIYNSLFMVPEIISSAIIAVVLMSIKPIRKICN